MKKNYEKPTLRTSRINLEEFVCVLASGELGCMIYPIDAAVNAFEYEGTYIDEDVHDAIL